MSNLVYIGEKTREISFPLGGIGTGCIGLAGNGRLIDWEIFNKPNKGSVNGFSHFAIRAEQDGQLIDVRVLNGDLNGSLTGVLGRSFFYEGFGWGPLRETMAGMPHFGGHEFKGEYPVAELTFSDDNFPARVRLMAFNPFIPTNDKDSGIPAAFFEIVLTNPTNNRLDFTVVGVLGNPFGSLGYNEVLQHDGIHALHMHTNRVPSDAFEYGDLCIATDAAHCSYQEYWYRGQWSDALEVYWRDISTPGEFKNRHYSLDKPFEPSGWHERDNGLLAAHVMVEPGQTQRVRFVIAWSFPNNRNYWSQDADQRAQEAGIVNAWKNYYATLWQDSIASAVYALKEWDRLYEKTKRFKDALFTSDLPDVATEAISATMSVLKTATVLRLEDGTFYGWEGVGESAGSCEGSCTHVWNYAQALAFLFPALERSMRTANYKYNVAPDGGSHFRIQLPLGMPYSTFRPCADGQFGDVMKTYRDWKISGDTQWLRSIWPTLKKTIEYAWSPQNPDRWDPERTGILWGRQHHTLDMELFGPNAWLTGYYLGALKAASEMAIHLGDERFGQELLSIFEKGKAWADAHLFNGEYYGQIVDLNDRDQLRQFDRDGDRPSETYWDDEHGEVKYQIGGGCHIDECIGQWHANLYGLGEVFSRSQVRQSLASVYKHNFKHAMRNEANPWRCYSINDEGGLIICTWPEGHYRPVIPLPYAGETQAGYEWAAAIHMIQSGLVAEGMTCVAAIRARYDGEKRNPWNEIECGSNYARSLASYSLLNAFSGFRYDMVKGEIGFQPIALEDGHFRCFWSLDSGWGTVSISPNSAQLEVLYGSLNLNAFSLPFFADRHIESVRLNGTEVRFDWAGGRVAFALSLEIPDGGQLQIQMS